MIFYLNSLNIHIYVSHWSSLNTLKQWLHNFQLISWSQAKNSSRNFDCCQSWLTAHLHMRTMPNFHWPWPLQSLPRSCVDIVPRVLSPVGFPRWRFRSYECGGLLLKVWLSFPECGGVWCGVGGWVGGGGGGGLAIHRRQESSLSLWSRGMMVHPAPTVLSRPTVHPGLNLVKTGLTVHLGPGLLSPMGHPGLKLTSLPGVPGLGQDHGPMGHPVPIKSQGRRCIQVQICF